VKRRWVAKVTTVAVMESRQWIEKAPTPAMKGEGGAVKLRVDRVTPTTRKKHSQQKKIENRHPEESCPIPLEGHRGKIGGQ